MLYVFLHLLHGATIQSHPVCQSQRLPTPLLRGTLRHSMFGRRGGSLRDGMRAGKTQREVDPLALSAPPLHALLLPSALADGFVVRIRKWQRRPTIQPGLPTVLQRGDRGNSLWKASIQPS